MVKTLSVKLKLFLNAQHTLILVDSANVRSHLNN